MAKLILGNIPKSFKRSITVELLDGEKYEIDLTFKFRTRSEYAKLLDGIMDLETPKKGKKAASVEEKAESASEVFARLGAGTVDFILDIVEGWDLDEPFNKESVATLIDSFPAATNAISEAYRVAILEGKRKN